ncbi:hypothetical protein LTR85_000261 [Meristemomyces frigidus]|nr:hypothetical protein LTR85_000261 [Meristemomyces frigidus]
MATIEPAIKDETVISIIASLTNLSPGQLGAVRRHLCELQNQHSPLFRLPRELREEIYDLVALAKWHDSLAGNRVSIVCFANMRTLAHSSRQFAAEYGRVEDRLLRLGMVVEVFERPSGTWRRIQLADVERAGHIQLTGPFTSTAQARTCVEGWLDERLLVHFPSALGMSPRVGWWSREDGQEGERSGGE